MPRGWEIFSTQMTFHISAGQISLYKTQITLTSLLARKQKPIDNLWYTIFDKERSDNRDTPQGGESNIAKQSVIGSLIQ